MTTLTDRTYAVHWDDPDELDGKVAGGPFRARLQVDRLGRLIRWNGFVCPHFERSEIERYQAFVAALPETEYGRVEFRGDELVQLPDPQYPDGEENVGPTADGLYPLGAFGWTWSICPPDLDPEGEQPTADELEAIGVDAGGRDGRGDITLANLTTLETARLAELRWNDYGYDREQAIDLADRHAAYHGTTAGPVR